jgi:hypothetical protein
MTPHGVMICCSSGVLYQVFRPKWWELRKWWTWYRHPHKEKIIITDFRNVRETLRVIRMPVNLPNVPSEKATHLYG